ncbi:SDR family oxidoreductase [Candidatus Woesearchaeota archaeon]|jgi:NAD(P)-dependent dehydrogenase (short-subunit alcohol dehydrogenase family)|nr:SDR family oxidoreductase [Candidatus Woesearchaeota archaeon]
MKKIVDLMNLKGRRALITGATGGIGKEIALTIAELGGDLILVDRPNSSYDSIKKSISDNWNVTVECVDCDLEDKNSRIGLIKEVIKSNVNLDILVNNAAFVGESNLEGWVEEFNKQSVTTWNRALEVNLTAPFHLCQAFTPLLKKNATGSIINIASIYGTNAPDYSLYKGTSMGNPAGYSASKGGLIQLTRWLSTTISPNVRVNAISPGGVFRNQPHKFVERYEKNTPLGRMATEEDFKGIIAYLSSDLSAYVTGQNFFIDGGWTV